MAESLLTSGSNDRAGVRRERATAFVDRRGRRRCRRQPIASGSLRRLTSPQRFRSSGIHDMIDRRDGDRRRPSKDDATARMRSTRRHVVPAIISIDDLHRWQARDVKRRHARIPVAMNVLKSAKALANTRSPGRGMEITAVVGSRRRCTVRQRASNAPIFDSVWCKARAEDASRASERHRQGLIGRSVNGSHTCRHLITDDPTAWNRGSTGKGATTTRSTLRYRE